jgi:hypothetical protein
MNFTHNSVARNESGSRVTRVAYLPQEDPLIANPLKTLTNLG